ncbi:ABC transporter substrate-binding protein [Rhodospirillaceae bacterium SYSU D60014]|uniref:ABC transporter substrate-binding protein n=1 Tax=Virgifigura deserti TaxID=2268457 RepID=UPI000E6722D0
MKRLLRGLLAATAFCASAALVGGGVDPAQATDLHTLVIGKSGDPDNLDPAVTMTNNSWTATYPAYERLVRFKVEDGRGTTEVEGELAESWTVNEDGTVWTFTLAGGHKFADGSPVDAEAVKFSFDRLLKIGKGPSDVFSSVEKVEAVDDRTVRFTLKEPFGPFLSTLVVDGAGIVNPAVMEHEVNGDMAQGYLADHSMGSGAFQVASWEKGQRIVMEPNPHYGGPEPFFEQVVIRIVKEATARRLQLEKGDLDIAEEIPVDQLSAMAEVPGVTIVDEPSFYVTYLYLNNERAPLDNVKVRQALSYAIDYQGIIDGILLGQGIQMRGAIPKGLWGHDPSVMQYEYDLEKAKALLAEAGVEDLKLSYLYAKTDPNWELIGLVLQQNLAPLGIEVELQEFAYPTMRDKLDTGDFDIAVGNWTPDYADPSMFMNFWFDSERHGLAGNRSFYTNPKVDELIREAATGSDQAERTKLYQEAQEIAVEEAAYVLLFQRNYQFAMRDDVEGYAYNPMLLQIWDFARMSKSE